jgi:hypothetical protein
MKTIITSVELKKAIQRLELQQASELIALKQQFHKTKDGFRLVNLIKGTFKDVVSEPGLKTDALNAAIGFTSGILAKKLMIGKTINPIKKLLGFVLEMAVANKIAKNADGIKLAGTGIFKSLFKKKEKADNL